MPFKTGALWNGNRFGRPKGKNAIADLMEQLLSVKSDTDGHLSKKEAILKVLITKAEEGDQRAIDTVLDRCYGKPHQSVDQTVTTTNSPIAEAIEKLREDMLEETEETEEKK